MSTLTTTQGVGTSGVGSASNTTIDSGGVQILGEFFFSTFLQLGVDPLVEQFPATGTGYATNTVINTGGEQIAGFSGGFGYSSDTSISGGSQYVGYSGGTGTAVSTTIYNGQQTVGSGFRA